MNKKGIKEILEETDVVGMIGKFEKIKKIIEGIEKYDFRSILGDLKVCSAWLELKKEIYELEAIGMVPCENTRPKNHIERMEEEAQELVVKIKKIEVFLSKEMEEKKYTDEYQRQLLAIQRSHMIDYYNTLLARINNDKNIKKEV